MIATESNLTCDAGDLNPYRRHSVRFNGDPHLVPLRANGPRPPLFCFNAIDGNANAYHDFVSGLSIDIPVYGFQAIHGEAAPESLGQMAQEHADSICRITANSPVRLFGFSFGALVAMHTAAVLEARFRRVQFVAVVDHRPFAAGDLAAKKRYLADYIRVVYSHLSSRLSVLRQISAPELQAAADAIAGHFVYDDSDPSLETMIDVVRRTGLIDDDRYTETTANWIGLFFARLPLIKTSHLVCVEAPLFVWRALNGIGAGKQTWSQWTRGLCEEAMLEGNHITVMKSPAVDILARQCSGLLDVYDGVPNSRFAA